MTRLRWLVAAVALGATLGVPSAALAADFSCVLLEVAVLDNRAHVLCAEPPLKSRPGYPKHNGDVIRYFAVPLSERDWSDRFIQVANIAMTAGLTIRFSYTPGDHSGEAFGCAPHDCRTPWAFTLEKVPSTAYQGRVPARPTPGPSGEARSSP